MFSTLYHFAQVTLGSMSYSDCQRLGQASTETGPHLSRVRLMGGSGAHKQNLERDFIRLGSRAKSPPPLYEAPVSMLDRDAQEVLEQTQGMLLPHELFAWFAQRPRQFEQRVLGGSWTTVENWFSARTSEPWYRDSEIQERLAAGQRVAPLLFYGDDAELQKRESALILTWSSPIANNIGVRMVKFPIVIIPLRLATPTTLRQIYALIRWSFQVLWDG